MLSNPLLERGELVARGLALAAALAVSLLAVSGAGGAGEQTPKRGGTVVIGRRVRARVSQRAQHRCAAAHPGDRRRSSQGPSRLARRPSARPRLGGRDHEETALHARLPHPSRGALERRGAGHGQDFVFTHQAFLAGDRPLTSAISDVRSVRRRREDSRGRPARALGRLARCSSPSSSRSMRSRGEDLAKRLAGRDRQSEDGRADRKRAIPRRGLGSAAGS